MIKCSKCSAENMLGAIFCRSCGTKLNIEDLRPETDNQRRQREGIHFGRIIYRLVVLALLFSVLAVLVGLFLPPSLRPVSSLSVAEQATAEKKFQSLSNVTMSKPQDTVTFSAAELTALANTHLLGGKAAGDANTLVLVPEQVTVDLLSSGYLLVTLKSQLMGKVPVYSTVVAGVTGNENDLVVSVFKVNAGRVPLPQAAWPFVLQRIEPVFSGNQDLVRVRKDISSVEITDNSATIHLRPLKSRLKNALSGARK